MLRAPIKNEVVPNTTHGAPRGRNMESNEADIISDLIINYLNGDDNCIKDLIEWFLNRVLIEEAEKNAENLREIYGSPEEAYRNGYKPRTLNTKNGKLSLNNPQFRYHPFHSSIFENYSRVDTAVASMIREAFKAGVSTRKMKNVIKELGIDDMSKSTISRLTSELDDEIKEFLNRKIELETPYVFVDATYFRAKENRKYVTKAAFIAYGINSEGFKTILGMKIAKDESGDYWEEFFDEMKERGLSGVKLVISDGHKGIQAAVSKKFLGAAWQMCLVHLKRNILNKIPKKDKSEVMALLAVVNWDEASMLKTADTLEDMGFVDAAKILRRFSTSSSSFTAFPYSHWKKIYTTNGVERINAEIKRRIRKVGAFPSEESAYRLIGAILMDVDEEWMCGRKCLDMSLMK